MNTPSTRDDASSRELSTALVAGSGTLEHQSSILHNEGHEG
jgi:hypothetical protein